MLSPKDMQRINNRAQGLKDGHQKPTLTLPASSLGARDFVRNFQKGEMSCQTLDQEASSETQGDLDHMIMAID